MKFKKCISSVIATSILIIVIVVSTFIFQTWFQGYSSQIYSNVEQTNDSISASQITNVVAGNLYFNGKANSSIQDILVDGKSCNISLNVSGIKSIDVLDCMNSLSTQTPEITVVLDSGVISKKVYLPDFKVEKGGSESNEVSFSPNEFVSYWNTSAISAGSSESNQVKLPLMSYGSSYNFIVDWGDNTNDTITSYSQAEVTHTYDEEGVYLIRITGEIIGFRFNGGGDKLKLGNILNWGDLCLGNEAFYFSGCSNMNFVGTDNLNLTGTTNLGYIFAGASSFNGYINDWDVSNVTSMSNMFNGASSFNQPLNNWDVSKVTSMLHMFLSASSFNQNLSTWNTSSVESVSWMFRYATSFNQSLSNWNLSKVSSFDYMFESATSFNQPLDTWNFNNVTDMGSMFRSASSFNGNITNWNVSSVTGMYAMLCGASSFNQNLSGWDVSNVESHLIFSAGTYAWVLPHPNFPS